MTITGNPWMDIPLDEYEAHMSLTAVGQAQFLADTFARSVYRCSPQSVAIVGCSGGNGLDRLTPMSVKRVVGVDINPRYLAVARERYADRFACLELICEDISSPRCTFPPVDLIFAGLVFEYVDYDAALTSIARLLHDDGFLSVVQQMPHHSLPPVSPSPYVSLERLAPIMNLVTPDALEFSAVSHGLSVCFAQRVILPSGKMFHEFLFRKGNTIHPEEHHRKRLRRRRSLSP